MIDKKRLMKNIDAEFSINDESASFAHWRPAEGYQNLLRYI